MMPVRPAVSRAIVRDVADTQLRVQLLAWPPPQTASGRAMQREDREALWITPDGVRERTAVGRLQRPQPVAHRSSIGGRAFVGSRPYDEGGPNPAPHAGSGPRS